MNTKKVAPLLAALAAGISAHAQPVAPTTAAPARTYRNPLLPDWEIADPFVLRLDSKYYLYPTTDAHGYEVFVSDDLVHWERKARVFEDPRDGDWAPEVFHNTRGDGKFYLYYTDNIGGRTLGPLEKQVGVAVADSPLGPFKDRGVLARHAIDADLFQDDDGKFYLTYVDLAHGFKIAVQAMATPLKKKGSPTVVIRPTEEWEMRSGHVTEGPFMLKHNGTYYLMYSGTGADSPNYGIGYAISKSPTGPFVKYAGNPIAHRGGNVLGPGHHCVIAAPDGKLWMLYHQKWNADQNFHRFLALDPLWFDENGVIHVRVTRDTSEGAP
ncbi:MAG TPA: glycoside hydrolase family 43 protein [Candidatus Acidoferrum sp.]|nr:glycoside hydrolase family 43 protein [Candidatus Acidoferrum sp.]